MKSKELKTKISHAHSLILSLLSVYSVWFFILTHTQTPYHLYLLLWWNQRNSRPRCILVLILWFSLLSLPLPCLSTASLYIQCQLWCLFLQAAVAGTTRNTDWCCLVALRNYLQPGGFLYSHDNFAEYPPNGTKFAYSNVGIGLIGLAVQTVSAFYWDCECLAHMLVRLWVLGTYVSETMSAWHIC